MSRFSCRFDLWDEIYMINATDADSEEYLFDRFYKATKGVIHVIDENGNHKDVNFTKRSDIAPYYGSFPATVASHKDETGLWHTNMTVAYEKPCEYFQEKINEELERLAKIDNVSYTPVYKCNYLVDEMCTNDKCPCCADYCPVQQNDYMRICIYRRF